MSNVNFEELEARIESEEREDANTPDGKQREEITTYPGFASGSVIPREIDGVAYEEFDGE